jgi:archaetidylinositol phosphate synthase
MVSLAMHQLAIGLIFFALSGFIDMVDGSVARATGQVSLKGAYVDGIVDRYVELFTCLGLLFYLGRIEFLSLPSEAWFMLLIFGSIMTSFTRAYADHRGLVKDPGELKKMGGLLERLERLMLLYIGMFLGLFDSSLLMITLAITAVLANATALQRIWFVARKTHYP